MVYPTRKGTCVIYKCIHAHALSMHEHHTLQTYSSSAYKQAISMSASDITVPSSLPRQYHAGITPVIHPISDISLPTLYATQG